MPMLAPTLAFIFCRMNGSSTSRGCLGDRFGLVLVGVDQDHGQFVAAQAKTEPESPERRALRRGPSWRSSSSPAG
jgi:hypothetical protein